MHKNKGGSRHTHTHKSESGPDFSTLQPPRCLPPNAEQKELPEEAKNHPGLALIVRGFLARGLSERRLSRLTHGRRAVTAARSPSRDPGAVKNTACERSGPTPRRGAGVISFCGDWR